ncbi:stage III sporulation protein AG [Paenibacillus beijingensis]|uniref:Stage III sporulation protein AG n=1 Tax=Paenibacillus beijingensis TaxID=1126833 RepID=A0A0D5NQK4_9BACL|nr:stage III sporulation protein AG [Paenibacillus beijingensis]AJY77262.1 stage III sporulation protein AG [Paenibacillus beijingensis]
MAKWLQKLESLAGGGPGGTKRVRTLRWLLLIGCLGAGLMIVNSFLTFRQVEPTDSGSTSTAETDQPAWSGKGPDADNSFSSIEQPLESRLKEILEQIVGVGSVSVMVTVDSTEEIVYGKNEKESQQITDENDKNGGRRHVTQVTRDGQIVMYEQSGEQTPVLVKKIKPEIRGVLVVAKGAENATVRRIILDAVEKGLDVPVSSISIVPRKQQ